MTTPQIPDIEGLRILKPLEMNNIHFDKHHTVLTPKLLEAMGKKSTGPNSDGSHSQVNISSPASAIAGKTQVNISSNAMADGGKTQVNISTPTAAGGGQTEVNIHTSAKP